LQGYSHPKEDKMSKKFIVGIDDSDDKFRAIEFVVLVTVVP